MSLFSSGSIAGLEPETKAKLRSTQLLASLSHLISELVQNSLDAGASHVEAGIDPAEWECWVRDDGQGMSAESLEMLGRGHDKGRYNTSKTYDGICADSSTFGFRGEALASAMELSCLEISSRTVRARESKSVIIKGGEQLYLGPSVRWRRERPGTTVVARDVFYNVPVRRKSHPNLARTLELAKKELETLAMVFPHVSFSLDRASAGQKNRILTIRRAASSLSAFRALYGTSSAARAEEVNLQSEDLRLEGFISLEGSQSRAFQHFYVNKHPMTFGDIQRAIEKCFASSAFSRLSSDVQDGRRSPRKTERKPVYVLNLSIPPAQVDNFIEPAKSMVRFQDTNRVLDFVLEAVNRFLAKHNFLSTQPQRVDTGRESPRKRARREDTVGVAQSKDLTTNLSSKTLPSHRNPPVGMAPNIIVEEPVASLGGSDYFEWIDPSSGDFFLIDSNTGNSFPSSRLPDYLREANDDITHGTISHGLPKRTSLGPGSRLDEAQKVPEWLVKALQHNPTFRPREQEVFSTETHTHTRKSWDGIYTSNLSQASKSTSQTFSIGDLKDARVIAQVDTKFIACLIQRSDPILVLVDQHAADERVRVERYLKRLCLGFLGGGVYASWLKEPSRVLLTRREADMLRRDGILNALGRWGLWVELSLSNLQESTPEVEREFVQVNVTGVPDVVVNKLSTERDMSSFVKSMLAMTEPGEGAPLLSSGQSESDWVKVLRHCPAPLLELVNSKACRGAIMFNDPLDLRQCECLMQQLSETVFPFQCAHGRPSIAPLTKLRGLMPQPIVTDWNAFAAEDG